MRDTTWYRSLVSTIAPSTLVLLTACKAGLTPFVQPHPTPVEAQQILQKYAFVDPGQTIPPDLLKTALLYFDINKNRLANSNVLSVIDFGAFSGIKRWYIIDMKSGSVWSTYVTHGMGSDPNWTGYATLFSNTINSDMTSLGFYQTAETYTGEHGFSERMDGLSKTNLNARVRAIVIHDADYVHDEPVKQGRSDGCFAVPSDVRDTVIGFVSGGSLIYAGVAGSPDIE